MSDSRDSDFFIRIGIARFWAYLTNDLKISPANRLYFFQTSNLKRSKTRLLTVKSLKKYENHFKDADIILIEVPYRVKYEEMLDYIINELRNRGISLPECS